jgi:hypothetical protein
MMTELEQAYANLTTTQTRCTEILEECRESDRALVALYEAFFNRPSTYQCPFCKIGGLSRGDVSASNVIHEPSCPIGKAKKRIA